MPSMFLPTHLRLSVLLSSFIHLGAKAQVVSPSVCDGAVTVTWIPPPFTVTVFTTGIFNASTEPSLPSDLLTGLSGPSLGNVPSLPTTLDGSILPTLSSLSNTLSLPEVPTSILGSSLVEAITSGLSTNPIELITASPSLSTSPLVSLSITSISVDLETSPHITLSPSLPTITELPSGSNLPTIPPLTDGLPTTISTELPQITLPSQSSLTVDLPDFSSSLSIPTLGELTLSSALPTDLPGSLSVSQTRIPTAVPSLSSLLSNAPSTSVSLPVVSLSSGLTTLSLSSIIPSLSSPTLSPILPTLSPPATPSGLSITSLDTQIGQSILPSSVTVSLGSLSTSLRLPGDPLSGLGSSASRSTRTAAVPTASVVAFVSCPYDNGLNYLSSGGKAFQIQCNARRLGNTVSQAPQQDLQSCIDSCNDVPTCESISYSPFDGTCFYMDSPGSDANPTTEFMSAIPIDLSCPGADGAQFMDHTGTTYKVMCDYSFPESSALSSSPGTAYTDCAEDCSTMEKCIGFSQTDDTCEFVQRLGLPPIGSEDPGTDTAIVIAKRAIRLGPDGSLIIGISTIPETPSYTGIGSLASATLPYITAPSISLPTVPAITTAGSISLDTSLTVPTSLLGLPTESVNTLVSIPSLSTGLNTGLIPSLSVSGLPSQSGAPSISLSPPSITDLPSSASVSLPTGLPSSPISISLPGLGPSSATIPTSQGPTQTAVSYTCPDVDKQVIVENGQSYVISCNSTTIGDSYSAKDAASSFNDCFRECDQSSINAGANYCTAFTYESPESGSGPGTCYLYNGVIQSFAPSNGRKSITAIRAVNYVPAAVEDGVSSLLSTLTNGVPGVTTLLGSSISLPEASSLLSLSGSLSLSVPSVIPTGLGGAGGTGSLSSNSLPSITSPPSIPATETCANGGNILNGCVLATATVDPAVGASGGVGVAGPSNSTILAVDLSATVGASVSLDAGLGAGVSLDSSGVSLGLSATLGAGVGLTAGASGGASGGLGGLGNGLGMGGGVRTFSSPLPSALASTTLTSATASATPGAGSPSPISSSTTSYYVTPLGPVVTTTTTSSSRSTTTVYTTSTVTSCLTGVGGVLTCPVGGLFTTLPSTSGDVTSVSTSTSTSVSISYVTVTVTSSSSSSTASTLTTVFSRTSSSSSSSRSSSSSTSTCRGAVNAAGLCVL